MAEDSLWRLANRSGWARDLGLSVPVLLSPMAGAGGVALAIGVGKAGGMASLPCAMLGAEEIEAQVHAFRAACAAPINLNFFCHVAPAADDAAQATWRTALEPYYREFGVADAPSTGASRRPFDAQMCAAVERTRPEVVSFHFGLPEADLLARVRDAGAVVLSSATTVAEARWLEANGCDAIIAQGLEAGGHRGMFLDDDLSTQTGTMSLLPLIVDAVDVPVIAAGGISDGRALIAALALGASAVQIGSYYLRSDESLVSSVHRRALVGGDVETALTNLFSGRPARGVMNRVMRELGPMSELAPPFPTAGWAMTPLKGAAESAGSGDFSSLWAGQSVALAREGPAETLTRQLVDSARHRLT